MMRKNLLFVLLVVFALPLVSQETGDNLQDAKRRKHRITAGLGLNIPMKPHSVTHDLGMSINERYEFLITEHLSLIQGLSYNFISGKKVEEFYQDRFVQTEYETFSTLPLQFGAGFYFGEKNSTFFILFKGGVAAYWGVNPAYPEIKVNGNVVKEAIPREEFNGVYSFFTPTIGWHFDRFQLTATYQGHVEADANVNILNLSVNYRIY
jgi:hypothetical protein